MTDLMTGLKRTSMCGQVTKALVKKEVTVMGWVHRSRNLGNLIFIQVRDITGIVQVTVDSACVSAEAFAKAEKIHLEYVVAIKGVVKLRDQKDINSEMTTGEIEIDAKEVYILSVSKPHPFSLDDNTNEALRMKYRYLDLRKPELQHNLQIRSKIAQSARNYLSDNGFLEIETPLLGKSTPEGARDYLVPSRVHNGKFYALPQSPQLYKQLLMIAGMDRYFQIVKCLRDEDLRANRQPEFSQIDIELSFVNRVEEVFEIIEGMICKIFYDVKGIKLKTPFETLTYDKAISMYGSDKPDIRFDMQLISLNKTIKDCGFSVFENAIKTGCVNAIVLKGQNDKVSRKDIDGFTELVKTYRAKGLAYIGRSVDGELRCSFAKFLSSEKLAGIEKACSIKNNDIAFIVADESIETGCTSLGALRTHLGSRFELFNKTDFKLVWIMDFPLFEYDDEEKRYVAKHHPFTSPRDEDISLFSKDPLKVKAKAYDLAINGEEAGGGSLRIYNSEVQKLMFKTLGFSEKDIQEKFGYFINAFDYGTPPHGGIAFGLDRLAMLLTGTDSLKDVIAFPKMQNACDLMSEAPNIVDDKQLNELGISIKKNG